MQRDSERSRHGAKEDKQSNKAPKQARSQLLNPRKKHNKATSSSRKSSSQRASTPEQHSQAKSSSIKRPDSTNTDSNDIYPAQEDSDQLPAARERMEKSWARRSGLKCEISWETGWK